MMAERTRTTASLSSARGYVSASVGCRCGWRSRPSASAPRLDDVLEGRPFDRYLALDSARYSLSSAAAFEDVVSRAAELGFTDVITHWPRPEGVYAGSEDVLEQVAAEVIPRLR